MILDGRRNNSFIKLKIPSTAIPSNRKGNNNSQNRGYKISASNANGHESINRIKKRTKVSIMFRFNKGLNKMNAFSTVYHNIILLLLSALN